MTSRAVINFGRSLKRLMAERDMTYRDLEIATGISDSSLYRYVVGKADPPLPTAVKIAEYFNTTVTDMVGDPHE